MAEYKQARIKKQQLLVDAFWTLFEKNNFELTMSVQEIVTLAGTNRSTFYFYFDGVHEVLDEIIEKLKEKFVDIFSSSLRREGNYKEFYKELYTLFKKYSKYLVPLVCDSRHPEFAKWYRTNQRENFKEDIGLAKYRMDKRKNQIINIALSGIIEEQVQTFGYENLSIEESFDLEYGMLSSGLLSTLRERFDIIAS